MKGQVVQVELVVKAAKVELTLITVLTRATAVSIKQLMAEIPMVVMAATLTVATLKP